MRQGPSERPRAPAPAPTRTFIDLAGASGATYRFERIDDLEQLPAIAGNFVYVQGEGRAATVICAGVDETLRRAGERLAEARLRHGAEGLYVRRNVSRRTRAQEHVDIVDHYRPVMILAAELDRPVSAGPRPAPQ
jgi:hypothetical protein